MGRREYFIYQLFDMNIGLQVAKYSQFEEIGKEAGKPLSWVLNLIT